MVSDFLWIVQRSCKDLEMGHAPLVVAASASAKSRLHNSDNIRKEKICPTKPKKITTFMKSKIS